MTRATRVRRDRRVRAVHVQPAARGYWWCVRLDGRRRALVRYPSRAGTIKLGRGVAERYGVPCVVHRDDGTVAGVFS